MAITRGNKLINRYELQQEQKAAAQKLWELKQAKLRREINNNPTVWERIKLFFGVK